MLFVQLLIIQLVIFGALAVLLRYVLTRHITSASSHLQLLTQECEKKLEEAKARQEEGERYYQEVLSKSREEGEALKQRLIREGQEAKQELLEQGRQEAEEMMKRARVAAELLLQELEQKIADGAIEKAHQLLQELLPGEVSEDIHYEWVEETIKNGLEGLARLHVSPDAREAQVTSAFPLRSDEKSLLQNALHKKLGRTIHLKEEVNPQLILGLKVTIDSLVIDGSLLFKIRESLRNSKHAGS